ncbi:MAG: DUF1844 domain-containing protein [Bdellovibrionales bacterium]|nr:DUF1844 domain-containing protein [Bdellovibrionales bacterium]
MGAENCELEADFSCLVMSLAGSAACGLGIAPNPETGKSEQHLEMAKFNIDLLMCLQEKTKGNLTDPEQKLLDRLVGDLRLQYIQRA